MTGDEPTKEPTDRDARFLDALAGALPPRVIVTDPQIVAGLVADDAEWAEAGAPIAVVRATGTADVQAVVRLCLADGRPVVARGSGTGLSGGANAVDGCVVVSLADMDEVLEIDEVERLAVVQPGVVGDDLRRAVAEHGLWYPPDPASAPWSSIGGNVATNAGGLCCVKYGVTRDYVLALEVVNGFGDTVRIGHRTAKGVAGYDLVGLFVGSEGTLGIVTEVTVRLLPLPGSAATIVGASPDLVSAGEGIRAVAAAGVVPAALELVDRYCLEAVDEWTAMGLAVEAEVLLLARLDDPMPHRDELAARVVTCFEQAGATWADRSTDEAEAEALFEARRLAYPAVERLGAVLTEDICVPRRAVPAVLGRIHDIGETFGVRIANIAHAGDGNLHPLIVTAHGDDEARLRAQAAFEAILDVALEVGGTVTGEHGVGLLKRAGLVREAGPTALRMHAAVKRALDPAGIFNPGKVIREGEGSPE